MMIVLLQDVNLKQEYYDELFNSYHYSSKYKNIIHNGDVFVYCHFDDKDISKSYYYGIGTIDKITTFDKKKYFAKLSNCYRFENKVSIFLPNNLFVEQLGLGELLTRKDMTSQIRKLSSRSYDYILNLAGTQINIENIAENNVAILNDNLRNAIRDYYVGKNANSLYRINSISSALVQVCSKMDSNERTTYVPYTNAENRFNQLVEYCQNMKMSYSYKPILIRALLKYANKDGNAKLEKIVSFFKSYYDDRKKEGLCVEKKKCIYLNDNVTDDQIAGNIISNPIKALIKTDFFYYNEEKKEFSFSPEIWGILDKGKKNVLSRICNRRLDDYYS